MTLPPNFGIYIATYSGDLKYCLGTIQSVRESIGDIPITLLIDGKLTPPKWLHRDRKLNLIFTRDIESPLDKNLFTGWGYSKILPFFHGPYDSFLVLDADTIVIGNILQHIDTSCDFYASAYKPDHTYTDDDIRNAFFKIEVMGKMIGPRWREFTPHFFLSGVFFSRKGLITYDEFVTAYEENRQNGDFLFPGDQGLLNYILMKKSYNRLNIGSTFFHFLSSYYHDDPKLAARLEKPLSAFREPARSEHPLVVHWGGNTKPYFTNYTYKPKGMTHFRLRYLRSLGFSRLRGYLAIAKQDFLDSVKLLYYFVKVKMLGLK